MPTRILYDASDAHLTDAEPTPWRGRNLWVADTSTSRLVESEAEIVTGRAHGFLDLLAFDSARRRLLVIQVKTELRESARTLPGNEAVVTQLPFGTLGLTICYDIRFPYLYQRLVNLGAIAVSVPSAFTATTGAAHWHTLLRARAIECQSYVIAPAQHGAHNPKRRSYGHSLVIDPWGEVIAELAQGDGVVVAPIDPARVAQVRAELPSPTHRIELS